MKLNEDIRMTQATMQVLDFLLQNLNVGVSGAEISRETNLLSGTLYPILHRLTKHGWLDAEKEDVDPSKVGRPRQKFYQLKGIAQKIAYEKLSDRGYYDNKGFNPVGAHGVT